MESENSVRTETLIEKWLYHEDPVDDVVENFIKSFRDYGDEVVEMFTKGKCYWFSKILKERFSDMSITDALNTASTPRRVLPKITYDPIDGHFTTKICGEYYDITGNVTEKYKERSFEWDALDDPEWKKRIIRDCVF